MASLFIGFALGHLEGQQNAPTDLQRVVDALESRRVGFPLRMSEIGVSSARREDKVVVLQLAIQKDHLSRADINGDGLGQKNPCIFLSAKDGAYRVGNIAGRQPGRGDLIQQRLEQMIIATIDDGDTDIAVLQGSRRPQAPEPRSHDDDVRESHYDSRRANAMSKTFRKVEKGPAQEKLR